ncbi:MAG: type I restriction endonuclease [Rhizonema sp. NSF051]|nr:type I restriction endonuclease [Rhizonema sp. NSF051]
MNLALPRIATVKASSLPKRLRHRDFTPSATLPDLLTWFDVIGYTILSSSDMPSRNSTECIRDSEIVLRVDDSARESCSNEFISFSLFVNCLRNALKRINPTIPPLAIETVISKVTRTDSDVLENNRCFHKLLSFGVDVKYHVKDQIVHDKVWLIDSANLLSNDWLVIHPSTAVSDSDSHSLNAVVFINGLPLAVLVWIHPSNKKATLIKAYQQLQIYKQKIPTLFSYNAFLVIGCGKQARVGTLTSDWKEFKPWRTIDGEDFPQPGETELEILIQGIFDKRRFLELLKHFIKFEETETSINKKLLRHPFCTIKNAKR